MWKTIWALEGSWIVFLIWKSIAKWGKLSRTLLRPRNSIWNGKNYLGANRVSPSRNRVLDPEQKFDFYMWKTIWALEGSWIVFLVWNSISKWEKLSRTLLRPRYFGSFRNSISTRVYMLWNFESRVKRFKSWRVCSIYDYILENRCTCRGTNLCVLVRVVKWCTLSRDLCEIPTTYLMDYGVRQFRHLGTSVAPTQPGARNSCPV